MKIIAVYSGQGVDHYGLHATLAALQGAIRRAPSENVYIIKSIDPSFFLEPGWEEKTALIVFPGGRDLPYHESLQGECNRRIRDYVEMGGSYLGICAGGYYGAAHIEFEKGGELEICGMRELAFFPGKAIGPAYGLGSFCYSTQAGAKIAKLKWAQGLSHVYFNGGAFFEDAEKYSSIEILARYRDLPDEPPAIIFAKVGNGRAILTGVHPEYRSRKYPSRGRDKLWQFLIDRLL